MDIRINRTRGSRAALFYVILLICTFSSNARGEYLPANSFKVYTPAGPYPLWSKTWLQLEPRFYIDDRGIPYISYRTGHTYNAVTIAVFGLLAYNRLELHGKLVDRIEFLNLAQWLVQHQDRSCGCWYYDFDFDYAALGDTLQKPWVSGMAQGVAVSVLTRAYRITEDPDYLQAATRALLPFRKRVDDGGVKRVFSLPSGVSAVGSFYEEYPTRSYPAFTLNGFMFALVGLYDLSQIPNQEAELLFQNGMETLERALPLYDLGDGSAYDLVHLTRPPRALHRDASYHIVHIALLNALGSATRNSRLLWYRDHWNSYGTPVDTIGIWIEHLGIWIVARYPVLSASSILFLIIGIFVLIRFRRGRHHVQTASATDKALLPIPALGDSVELENPSVD